MTPIAYQINKFDVGAHEFHVRLVIADPDRTERLLRMPAWIPGSYMIRDFARNVTGIRASDARGAVVLHKTDKQTWAFGGCQGALTVDYTVYAFDLSVRAAFVDSTRAYFNGTALFLTVVGVDQTPCRLELIRPQDGPLARGRVATTLPAQLVDADGFGSYEAADYAHLVDCPFEIGRFEEIRFAVDDVAHRLAVSDAGHFNGDRLVRDLGRICAEHVAMFGDLPLSGYLFQLLALADGYGGLEHRDSTSLVCKRTDLPQDLDTPPDKGYRQLLGLCSHEYFHLWNVKRIRPQRLIDGGLEAEVHTELLWAFEGITSYYDELALARSGVLSRSAYLDLFATTVSRVLRNPGRLRQSIAESSFDAWTRFYKQDQNAANAIVSYYTKGALVAFGLDVSLRELSDDRLSLDDLMRRLWHRYGQTGRGIPERGVEAEAAELAGRPLNEFFEDYVYGTVELPLADWFAAVGVGYRARAAQSGEDLGGCVERPDRPPAEPRARPALGARCDSQPAGLRLISVIQDGAAQRAGLAPDDVLLTIDSERVTAANLGDLLARAVDGEVAVHYFRRDRLYATVMPVLPAVADTCDLWLLPDAELDEGVRRRRDDWLASRREAAPAA